MGASLGQGSLGITPGTTPSGAPFPSSAAYNGLSVDSTTGQIVLGQDIGDPSSPGILATPREIPLAGNDLNFNNAIDSGAGIGASQGNIVANILFGPPGGSYQFLVRGARNDGVTDGLEFSVSKHGFQCTDDVNGVPINVMTADNISVRTDRPIATQQTIATGDPGGGVGVWKLGKKIAAAVVLDNANYVEVDIDGVVYKLALVN